MGERSANVIIVFLCSAYVVTALTLATGSQLDVWKALNAPAVYGWAGVVGTIAAIFGAFEIGQRQLKRDAARVRRQRCEFLDMLELMSGRVYGRMKAANGELDKLGTPQASKLGLTTIFERYASISAETIADSELVALSTDLHFLAVQFLDRMIVWAPRVEQGHQVPKFDRDCMNDNVREARIWAFKIKDRVTAVKEEITRQER